MHGMQGRADPFTAHFKRPGGLGATLHNCHTKHCVWHAMHMAGVTTDNDLEVTGGSA